MNLSNGKINNSILSTIQISSQENILLNNIEKFYKSNMKETKEVVDIIRGSSKISMRLIDYFVTNYSKKFRIKYKIKVNSIDENFGVYSSYKSQLKCLSKNGYHYESLTGCYDFKVYRRKETPKGEEVFHEKLGKGRMIWYVNL